MCRSHSNTIAALFGAAVLPGVLLAVYGQVYQTGADHYGLFLTWCLLVTPWVLIGRSAALWLLWLVLANLSLILWWAGVHRPPEWLEFAQMIMPLFGMGFVFADADLALLVTVINLAALLLYEGLACRVAWLSGRWMPRVILLVILATLIVPVLRPRPGRSRRGAEPEPAPQEAHREPGSPKDHLAGNRGHVSQGRDVIGMPVESSQHRA